MTLRKKFFVMAVAVLLTAILIVGFMMVIMVHLGSDENLMGYAAYRRRVIRQFDSLEPGNRIDFDALGPVPARFRFLVISEGGKVEYASYHNTGRTGPDTERVVGVGSSGTLASPAVPATVTALPTITDGLEDMQFIIETEFNTETGHSLLMLFSKDTDVENTEYNPIRGLFIFVVVFLIVSGGGSLVVERAGRSIRALASAAERIAGGDMDFDIPGGDRSDEISSLRESFQIMRDGLKEENAKRARFLMAVSHDLRTPLTSIEGYVEAIKDGLAGKPEDLQRYLDIISTKASVLEDRILELIDFVNMETGEWKLRAEEIDLTDFLNNLAADWCSEAEVLNRRFRYLLDTDGSIRVIGDSGLLSRVFDNLFDNAVRYSRDGGTITLRVGPGEGDGFDIVVSDDGPGIPEGMEERIFEPFYRGTRSRREQGFGLGLSIVRSILDAHGWRITVRRDSRRGAAFLIRIPASR
jgi:signal transduction histidine kinase